MTAGGRRLAIAGLLSILGFAAMPTAEAREPDAGVVLVGVAGLAWSDITAEDTPALYSLVEPNAAASLTVRTVRSRTCTVDGWLTVGAGRRATDAADVDANDEHDRFCRDVPQPVPVPGGGAVVPDWEVLVAAQEEQTYETSLGLLGDRIDDAGTCAIAVGPGAALALGGAGLMAGWL